MGEDYDLQLAGLQAQISTLKEQLAAQDHAQGFLQVSLILRVPNSTHIILLMTGAARALPTWPLNPAELPSSLPSFKTVYPVT